MSDVRRLAESIGRGSLTEWGAQKAQALAILDLADATRESGRTIAASLDIVEAAIRKVAGSLMDIEAGIAHLAKAVQELD